MRTLIAVTCASVLCLVTYHFWGEYTAYRARSDRADQIERVRQELFTLAKADDGDRQKVVSFCNEVDNIIENFASPDTMDMWRQTKTNCRALGYY